MQKDRKKGLDGLYLYVQDPYYIGMNINELGIDSELTNEDAALVLKVLDSAKTCRGKAPAYLYPDVCDYLRARGMLDAANMITEAGVKAWYGRRV